MKRILAFGATTSSKSINKRLANFVGNLLQESEFTLIDLNDFTMPMYSIDEELKNGFSENTIKFSNLFEEYDGFIISLAEHNGYFTAVFKNMFDWASRVNIKIFRNKPVLLTSTSPGKRGGLTVLEHASLSFPRFGAKQVVSFSLPSFGANFNNGEIVNETLLNDLQAKVKEFENLI